MDMHQIESTVLQLPLHHRAALAERLLKSLDDLSDAEHDALWVEEALRRDAELDADPAMGRDADEVFREIRAQFA